VCKFLGFAAVVVEVFILGYDFVSQGQWSLMFQDDIVV